MTVSPLANHVLRLVGGTAGPVWQETAGLIGRAGRFLLSPEVVKLTLKEPEPDRLLPAVAHGIRLPHDPCWIEYSPAEVFGDRPMVASHFGNLLWTGQDGEVHNRLVVRRSCYGVTRAGELAEQQGRVAISAYPFDLVFRPDGMAFRPTHTGMSAAAATEYRRAAERWGWLGLMFVLLLTARNAPLTVGAEEDLGRLNRQRQRSGKPVLLAARPVQWNLSREERRAVRASLPFDRRVHGAAMAHMVRGHLKIRSSGVFWWSPHFRKAGAGEPDGGRDYHVR